MIHFAQRRQNLQKQLNENSAILLRQPAKKFRNSDVHYPFHPDRDFFYLTGFEEPNAWLLITKDSTTLWSEENNSTQTLWDGPVLAEQALSYLNIDKWYSIQTIEETLAEDLKDLDHLYLSGEKPSFLSGTTITDASHLIHAKRIIKDELEIDNIAKACQISADAHNYLMTVARSVDNECVLSGHFIQKTMEKGADSLAYPSIVAGGKNACILHYTANNAPLSPKELILVDAGCEYGQYTSDITRTFPKSGKFSKSQREIYEAVLDAQISTIKEVKPGTTLTQLHNHATRILTQHLIDLKLIQSSLDDALQHKDYLAYFPHRIGHTMGLDVHDIHAEDDTLKPGMVITIEPGLYISTPGVYQHIGIRIEDDILVTDNASRNLSEAAVKTVSDIEYLMSS